MLQTTTPTAGVGPAGLVELWPVIVGAAWFAAGFLVVVLFGSYVVEPVVARVVRRRNRNNPTVQEAISRYLRLLVLLVALYVGAGAAGFGEFVTSSALVVAAGTLAVGVAAREVIGSLVGGTVLVLDPEFNVGNYVEWDGGEGTIRSITLRVTRVQTMDGELVTIPNTVLTTQAITRPYGHGRYRIVDRVGLAYDDDVDEALGHLRAAAENLESILDAPSPTVYVEELGSDAVVVRVHYWIENPSRRDVFATRSDYALAAKSRLEAAGITISPPSKRALQGRIDVGEPA